MIPAWNERWRRHARDWCGTLVLTVDGITVPLRLSATGVALGDGPHSTTHALSLTGRAFLPLLFGFRSVAWAAIQDDQHIPADLMPILEILFPPLTPWIAPTDGC